MRIKKIILILALAAPLSAECEHYFGAHYAAGISTIYFLPHKNETWRLTPYDAGLVYRYYDEIEKHTYFNIGLQIELNIAARRYVFDDIENGIAAEGEQAAFVPHKLIRSQVAELPVVMQWQFPVYGNFRLYINGLMYAAYYLYNTAAYANAEGRSVTERFDYTNWNNFDFGIGGGIGAGYQIGSMEVGFDVRFVMGISELYKQTVSRYESMPQQYLISISVVRKL